jgi:hypothetical protein
MVLRKAVVNAGFRPESPYVQPASFAISGASSGFCSSPKPGASLGRTRAFLIWHCAE